MKLSLAAFLLPALAASVTTDDLFDSSHGVDVTSVIDVTDGITYDMNTPETIFGATYTSSNGNTYTAAFLRGNGKTTAFEFKTVCPVTVFEIELRANGDGQPDPTIPRNRLMSGFALQVKQEDGSYVDVVRNDTVVYQNNGFLVETHGFPAVRAQEWRLEVTDDNAGLKPQHGPRVTELDAFGPHSFCTSPEDICGIIDCDRYPIIKSKVDGIRIYFELRVVSPAIMHNVCFLKYLVEGESGRAISEDEANRVSDCLCQIASKHPTAIDLTQCACQPCY